jgi:hypothetical protein
MTYVIAAMTVMMVVETWCLWRVLVRLGGLDRVEERLASVAHSLELLTDATETCFQVVASQLEGPKAPGTRRASRQRRVVGAARRGQSVNEIAVEEEVAESEVRLRLHLAERAAEQEGKERHGSMLTS